ncbi:hypothetical protein PV392_00835 [Streptomyces sp. ME03-5709C]|nr:hypothetical protein [Streptomyces sp. ME03-5709C]
MGRKPEFSGPHVHGGDRIADGNGFVSAVKDGGSPRTSQDTGLFLRERRVPAAATG